MQNLKRLPSGIALLLATLSLPLATVSAPVIAAPLPALTAPAEDEEKLENASKSQVIPVQLPSGTLRSTSKQNRAQFAGAFRRIAQERNRRIGEVEILTWIDSGNVKTTLPQSLKEAGYVYVKKAPIEAEGDKITLFAAVHKESKREVLGMWVDHGKQLIMAWTVLTPGDKKDTASGDSAGNEAASSEAGKSATEETPADRTNAVEAKPSNQSSGQPIVIEAAEGAQMVNVMGKALPALPSFPKVTPKPGVVRGYVRDTQNRPLTGALIGVRSSAVGGFYSGASAKTDANGYYEISAPSGAAHFYCAGYAMDYGDLIAAFGLYPADGEIDGFATTNGVVKNWVLLPYGIANRAKAQENPHYAGNYFGGTIYFHWNADEDKNFPNPNYLPPDGQIEITLTPDGPLVDGSKGRPIIIHRKVGTGLLPGMYVNNIPVGRYKIAARLVGGKALRLKESGPYRNQSFGLEPKEAVGEAALLLKVEGADPNKATAAFGNWQEFQIGLDRP